MNEQIKFKALNFTEKQIGKIVKSSKKEYIWQFEINNKTCFLSLKVSKFSGNYTINLNKSQIHKGNIMLNSEVDFSFKIKQLNFDIYRKKDTYELSVEGTVFNNYYEDINKRKSVFVKLANGLFQAKSQRKIRNTSANVQNHKQNLRSYSFNKLLQKSFSNNDLCNFQKLKKNEIKEELEEESENESAFDSDVFTSQSITNNSNSLQNELDNIYNVQKEYQDSIIQQQKKQSKDFQIYEDIEIEIEPLNDENRKKRNTRLMHAIYKDLKDTSY